MQLNEDPFYGDLTVDLVPGEAVRIPSVGPSMRVLRLHTIPQVAVEVLREVAQAHDVQPAAVALAWLRGRPGVVAPLASARNVEQLSPILAALSLELSPEETERLTAASDEAAAVQD